MGLAVVVVVVSIVGLAIGSAFVFASPILAIPILLLAPGPIFMAETMRRQSRRLRVKRFREQAQTGRPDFDRPDTQRTIV